MLCYTPVTNLTENPRDKCFHLFSICLCIFLNASCIFNCLQLMSGLENLKVSWIKRGSFPATGKSMPWRQYCCAWTNSSFLVSGGSSSKGDKTSQNRNNSFGVIWKQNHRNMSSFLAWPGLSSNYNDWMLVNRYFSLQLRIFESYSRTADGLFSQISAQHATSCQYSLLLIWKNIFTNICETWILFSLLKAHITGIYWACTIYS